MSRLIGEDDDVFETEGEVRVGSSDRVSAGFGITIESTTVVGKIIPTFVADAVGSGWITVRPQALWVETAQPGYKQRAFSSSS